MVHPSLLSLINIYLISDTLDFSANLRDAYVKFWQKGCPFHFRSQRARVAFYSWEKKTNA